MKNISLLSKTIAFIAAAAFTLWLGSYFSRLLVVYQLFDAETLQLKSIYDNNVLNQVFYTILPLLLTNISAYLTFLIFFILFIFISKIKLKQNGWLFIILLIVLVTAPFELFLIYKDYQIVNLILGLNPDSLKILETVKDRMLILNSFSLIEVFCFIAIIFLTIFKPLKKNNEN